MKRRVFPFVLSFLVVLLAYFVWDSTRFKPLSDEKLGLYLSDAEKPRNIQHALNDLSRRIGEKQDASAWYPQLIELASNPHWQVRQNVAWVMGDDPRHAPFGDALRRLVADDVPLVRFQAAWALTNSNDPAAVPVLVEMLEPFPVKSPQAGRLTARLKMGEPVRSGVRVARIAGDAGEADVLARLDGRVGDLPVPEEAQVAKGEVIMFISPSPRIVHQALVGLAAVGTRAELDLVKRYAAGVQEMPDEVRRQAEATAAQIRSRAGM